MADNTQSHSSTAAGDSGNLYSAVADGDSSQKFEHHQPSSSQVHVYVDPYTGMHHYTYQTVVPSTSQAPSIPANNTTCGATSDNASYGLWPVAESLVAAGLETQDDLTGSDCGTELDTFQQYQLLPGQPDYICLDSMKTADLRTSLIYERTSHNVGLTYLFHKLLLADCQTNSVQDLTSQQTILEAPQDAETIINQIFSFESEKTSTMRLLVQQGFAINLVRSRPDLEDAFSSYAHVPADSVLESLANSEKRCLARCSPCHSPSTQNRFSTQTSTQTGSGTQTFNQTGAGTQTSTQTGSGTQTTDGNVENHEASRVERRCTKKVTFSAQEHKGYYLQILPGQDDFVYLPIWILRRLITDRIYSNVRHFGLTWLFYHLKRAPICSSSVMNNGYSVCKMASLLTDHAHAYPDTTAHVLGEHEIFDYELLAPTLRPGFLGLPSPTRYQKRKLNSFQNGVTNEESSSSALVGVKPKNGESTG